MFLKGHIKNMLEQEGHGESNYLMSMRKLVQYRLHFLYQVKKCSVTPLICHLLVILNVHLIFLF